MLNRKLLILFCFLISSVVYSQRVKWEETFMGMEIDQ
jgi:hypothetical protein